MDKAATILKRDALGRVTHTREQREALLDEFERSGMKGRPFARMAGVSYPTFATWIQKRRRARGDYEQIKQARESKHTGHPECKPAALRLMEVVPAAAAVLELLLPGGARLLLHDAHQAELAAHLLRNLNAQPALPC
jgi:hypothetical protein